MMEFISSKVVGAIAVVVLLGSVVGVLNLQTRALEEERFKAMCESLASAIDSASSVSARVVLRVTFTGDAEHLSSESGCACRLERAFRGDGYEVEVHRGQVVLRQGSLIAARGLVRSVHPWAPALLNGSLHTTSGEFSRLDALSPILRLQSGRDFIIERALVVVDGEPAYATFVHI